MHDLPVNASLHKDKRFQCEGKWENSCLISQLTGKCLRRDLEKYFFGTWSHSSLILPFSLSQNQLSFPQNRSFMELKMLPITKYLYCWKED